MLSNCGHDERGRYTGGSAGDQTGSEWQIVPWYSRPWRYMFRHPNPEVRKKIAEKARAAARNNRIGYDQGQRYTFWQKLEAAGYDPAKINVPCEADCSSGVAAIVKAVGYDLGIQALKNISIYCYTGNLRAALVVAGFECYTESKYLISDQWLKAGDILLLEGAHTAINVDDGVNNTAEAAPAAGVDVSYRVYTAGSGWLPTVTNLTDFAGIEGRQILGFGMTVSRGHASYRAHILGGGWLPWVDTDDYDINDLAYGFAGDLKRPIDAIAIYYFTEAGETPLKEAVYRVDTTRRNTYFSWQTDTDTDKGQDGYAGSFGEPIDRVQVAIK